MSNPTAISLVDLLELRARQDDGRFAFTFLSDDGNVDGRITYTELDRQSRTIAARIMEVAAPGERALLLYPPGLEFISAFFACLYASVIAVPAYPPHRNRNLLRLQTIFRDAQPCLVLTTAALLPKTRNIISTFAGGADIRVIATDDLPVSGGLSCNRPQVSHNTIALLQYTSGSTAAPKGVMLTHGNLLHNTALVNDAVGPAPDDSYVSWLPVFHDMGFMAGILQPLYRGLPSVLMAPAAFLAKPVRWLQAISRYKATASGGPSFAYELCVRRIEKADLDGIDLSSWTIAFNGSEPVRADVMDRFAATFVGCGFRRNAFYPCYGLAEATLMVSGSGKSQPVVVGEFSKGELENHRVCQPGADEQVHRLVSCGRDLPGQEIVIVDPESHRRSPSDQVGEIWVKGPSVASGYWNNPKLSEEIFNARIHGEDASFLRTGDLGFLRKEQLFITGRIKDLLIVRGQNHYPQDIELTVETCGSVLQPGSGAAFSVEAGNEERLVVVQEVANRAHNDWEKIFASIRCAIAENHELAPYAIVLTRSGTIPKTSSGKIQRAACKHAFSSGELRVLSAWYEQEHAGPGLIDSEQVAANESRPLSPFAASLVQEIALKTGVAPDKIAFDQPLTAYGVDSLAATELVHKLQVEFGLDLKMADLFEGVTLAEIVSQAEQTHASAIEFRPQTSESRTYPLTHGQRAILFLQQMAPHSSAYNIARAVRITSKVDIDLLQRSFQTLVDRHPALRTTFVLSHDGPLQQVHPETRVCFEQVDASSLSQARLVELLGAQNQRAFDLVNGPLFCACLYTRSERDHVLQLVVHHLIADFWSLIVLLDDLGKLYRARGEINSAGLPPLKCSYADFVSWQDRLISGPHGEKLWSYWEQVLSGEVSSLNLPADRSRPAVSSFRGAALEFVIDPPLIVELKKIASGLQTTLFMVLMGAFQVLLYRLTAQARFAVGVPTSGRARAEFSGLAGYFVNVLPVVADFTGSTAFTKFLTDLRHSTVKSFAHDLYPFPLMVEKLGISRGFNSSPIFQTMFVFQKAQGGQSPNSVALAMGAQGARFDLGGLELEPFPVQEQTAQFDLVLTMGEGQQGLLGTWQYSTDLFDDTTVVRWSHSFVQLLRGIVADPGCAVNELPVVPEEQLASLLVEFNRTELEYDRLQPLHAQIAHQALLDPDRSAIVCEATRFSYRELDLRANQIAHDLHRRGVGTEDLVAVCMTRSPEMVAAMLGVWKAGAAYVPLDPQYPHQRLQFMLEDSCAKFVLTEGMLRSRVQGTTAKVIDLNEISESTPKNSTATDGAFTSGQLAYLIYTSGSTGTPKGVMLTHQNAMSFAAWARNTFSHEEFSGVLATTSVCFDLSVFELWATLSSGGTVILAENILEWCDHWADQDAQPQVRLINTVPSAMERVLERGLPPSVSTVNLAGEALQVALVRKILATGVVSRVNNLYGPTETTTYSSWTTVTGKGHVTIGRGVANTQLYVLDHGLQLVPIGVVGELCIGGSALARGYWQHPDWTAERFVPNPFSTVPGERLFRTGDLVRWQADGQLLYIGRADQQVKIRGFRIELGEISTVLGRWNNVRENAVAVVEESDDKQLVAYVVPVAEAELTPEQIRDYLRRQLPEWMVPNHIVLLPDLPKTSSGKIDRNALPPPLRLNISSGRMPETRTEREIAAIWQTVLNIENVGADDDFFLLGGHSLLMMQLKSRLEAQLDRSVSLAQLLQSPTVAGMARVIESLPVSNPLPPIMRADKDGPVELSFAQERIWFLEHMFTALPVYNVAGAVRLKGELNKRAVRESLQQIVQRHAALRTAFVVTEGVPLQQVQEEVSFELEETDLRSGSNGQDMEELLRSNLEEEAKRVFLLHQAPLIRTGLFQTGHQDCTLIVVMHHIVADGWTIGVLLRELEQLYRAYCEARPPALPPLNFQFTDYALWQRRLLHAGNMNDGLAYWKEQLSGAPPLLDLPGDTPRPAQPTYQGSVINFDLGKAFNTNLKNFCRQQGITPYLLLLSCFQLLLSRYSGQTDIVVGSPVADRQQVESEGLIGLFANLVPMRARIDAEEALGPFLQQRKHTVTQAQAWQYIPFEKIVEQVEAQRNASHMPLVQAVFAWQIGLMGPVRFGEIVAQPRIVHTDTAKFDLMLTIEQDKDSELVAWIEYSLDIFSEKTIRQMAGRYLRLMEQAVSNPLQRIGDLSLLDEYEQKQILTEWSGASHQARPGWVHVWFEQHARRCPEATAIVAGNKSLSYRDLNATANQVAHLLIARGIGPEKIVGICFERSEWMIVAILAVLKAGAAYLPLDHEYPPDRLAYMLHDAGAAFVLSEQSSAQKMPGNDVPTLLLDQDRELWQKQSISDLQNRAHESSLAYVIYTSGSTGQPKGVMVQHGNLSGLLSAADTHFGFRPEDRWTLFHLYSFDFSVWEIWGALAYGGTLVIVPSEVRRSPSEFCRLLRQENISILSQVPSAFYQLADYEEQTGEPVHVGLRAVVFGGEALDVKRLKPWIERYGEQGPLLVNMYGITETTIHVTHKRLAVEDIIAGRSVIGSPLPGYRTWLLDQRQMLLPPGIPGEIYVGGTGVARGYLNKPALTAERFVPDPFENQEGGRLYRTGDLGRYLADGTIEYVGRIDHQVKLRGYRIELGEIEAKLKHHAAVEDCAVLVKPEPAGDHRLVAYIAAAQSETLQPANLRAFLKSELPDYMVPTQFIFLDRLPLTPNGKIDHKRLLQLKGVSAEASGAVTLDPTQELIAGIWSGLLGVTELSAESNFFDLGGHSLLATQMLLRLRQVFDCDVPLRSLFEFSSLGELATHIKELTQSPASGSVTAIIPSNDVGNRPLSSGQQRLWFLDQFAASSHAYNIAGAARLRGELHHEALRHSFQAIIRRHEILRTGFVERQGRPCLIYEQVQFDLEVNDLSRQLQMEHRLAEELRRESTREFALDRPPLLRAILFQLGEQEHVLLVVMHHIIADAWTIEIMVRELTQFYAAYQAGAECEIQELPFQYPDYATWERDRWANGDFATGLDYWRRQLEGAPRLELPADFSRENVPSYQGHMLQTVLDTSVSQKLKELARSENVTLFMLLLAGFQVLLSQYTGEEDVVVGTSVANRNISGTENLMGLFTNEVVLRTRLHGDPSFRELLSRVRETTLSAYSHQDVPFGRLVEALQPQRDFSRNPFFQATILLNNDPLPPMRFGNLGLEPMELEIETAIFDLSLIFTAGTDGRIRVALRHSRRFKTERMEQFLKDLIAVFDFMLQKPAGLVSELSKVLAPDVDSKAPDLFMSAGLPWSEFSFGNENIPHVFEQQVEATHGSIAVRYEEQCLTFAGLNERANRVANYLLCLGVKNEDYVALCLERSVEIMVAILGILKAGAAYVPLDRTYPVQRLQYIIEETDAAVILTQQSLAELFAGMAGRVVCIDDDAVAESSANNPKVAIQPDNLAYAIYTSGSTGTPKGVMVRHRSVLNLLQGLEQAIYSDVPASACVSMNAPVVFDASVKQWIRLLKGNSLCILPEEKRFDPEALVAYLNEKRIDVLDCTPSVLRLLLNEGTVQSVNVFPSVVLVGGEAIDTATWERLQGQGQIAFYNVYGPTECTVDVAVCRVSESGRPSIGFPISNVQTYILNDSLQPLPPGQLGELCVSGIGLARGYCRRPDLTAERFIPDPISGVAGSRLYRTGDLARMLPGGRLEFCGRYDDQVKIRGYRVELEEITAVLRKVPGVRDAVVLMTQTSTGPSRLLAYVVPEPSAVLNPEQLRDGLRRQMPEYMTPSGFIILDKLPVTVNGKVDRKALVRMSDGQRTASSTFAPARNPMEETVTAIWMEVLGLREAGVHDNFFDLGGHSLAMVQVRSRLRELLKREVPMVELFRNPTIALLSRYLQEGSAKTPVLHLAQSRAGRRIKAANRVSK